MKTAHAFRTVTVAYLLAAVVAVAFVAAFADFLFRNAAYFPAIDQRNFFSLANIAAGLLADKPHSWGPFRATLPSEYNALFALPLAPGLLWFGSSFYVYGMSLAVIYVTATCLSVSVIPAVILRRLPPWSALTIFVATLVIALTRSTTWFAVGRYYPDIGDAFVLALWLIAAIQLIRHPDWRHAGLTVVLTLVALLFRRHNVFSWGATGIGLAVAIAVTGGHEWYTSPPPRRRHSVPMRLRQLVFLGATAVIALGVIFLAMPSFVKGMAALSINDAYADFENRPDIVATTVLTVVGIGPAALSLAGYAAAAVVFSGQRLEIMGVGLGAVLQSVLWCVVLRQIGPQYEVVPGTLFVPVGLGLGVAALLQMGRPWYRCAALGFTAVALVGCIVGFIAAATSRFQNPLAPFLWQGRVPPQLWQAPVQPVTWHAGMAAPFRQVFARIAPSRARVSIFVDGSSLFLNEATAQSAAEALLGKRAGRYIFLEVPASDARDRLPLSELMEADDVLVPDPPQFVLPRGGNGLLATNDLFAQHAPIAADFKPLGGPVVFPRFSLMIYQRDRPTDEATAIATLSALRAMVPRPGFGQPFWIELGPPSRSRKIDVWLKDDIVARDRDDQDGWPARFLSEAPVSGVVDLDAEEQTDCPAGARLTLRSAMVAPGVPRVLAAVTLPAGTMPHRFSLRTTASVKASHLIIEIDAPHDATPCDIAIRRIEVTTGPNLPSVP